MTQKPAVPASQDPVHLKLDILAHSMMESRAENKMYRHSIVRAQWLACATIVLVILVAAIFS